MTNQPTNISLPRDPLCPYCGKPFNVIRDFKGRVGFFGTLANVYQCPHCKHNIYRMGDGTPAPEKDKPANES